MKTQKQKKLVVPCSKPRNPVANAGHKPKAGKHKCKKTENKFLPIEGD